MTVTNDDVILVFVVGFFVFGGGDVIMGVVFWVVVVTCFAWGDDVSVWGGSWETVTSGFLAPVKERE